MSSKRNLKYGKERYSSETSVKKSYFKTNTTMFHIRLGTKQFEFFPSLLFCAFLDILWLPAPLSSVHS